MSLRRRASIGLVAVSSGFVLYTVGKRYIASKKKASSDRDENESDLGLHGLAVQEFMRKRSKNPAINRVFLKQLIKLIKISIPSVFTKEFGLLLCHTGSLVARTFLSIYIAHLDGRLVKSIVDRNPYKFLQNCITWVLIALPATFVNSLIRFLESKLALAIRARLVTYAYSLYFKNQTYYRVSNLDTRLANPDHSLTEDVQAFSSAVTHIYSHLSKPILDLVLLTGAIGHIRKRQGVHSPYPSLLSLGMIFLTGWVLKVCSPPFGKLVAEEARRNGYLRYVHSRLITNAEEVAFYGGHQVRL